MERDATMSPDEEVTSTINVAPKYVKNTATSKRKHPDDMSDTGYDCDKEMFSSKTPEAAERVWTSQDDEDMDSALSPKEADIRHFIESFREFHALMIQLNESQYFASRMDVAHASLETDLLDMLGELAYRRGEEAEELRQKAELEELLKTIKDDDEEDNANEVKPKKVSENDDDTDDSSRVVTGVTDELLNKVVEGSDNTNE